MKLESTVLVLLVILVATFGHGGHQSRKLTPLTSPNDGCGLQFVINSTSNLVAILNETAARAHVFDVSNSYTATFSGSTGTVTLVDFKSKNGLFIAGNSSRVGWVAQSQSFVEFFKSLGSLKSIFTCNEKTGIKFSTEDASSDVRSEIKLTLIALSNSEYFVTKELALEYFMRFEAFAETLKGPLNGLLKILGNGVKRLGISGRSLMVIIDTLGEIFCKVKGGVSVLAEINLDWNLVFHTRSWRTLFYPLFSKLKKHNVDVKSILANYNKNFATPLAGLVGNFTHGTNGMMGIIAESRVILMGKRDAYALVDVLLEYFTQCGNCGATYEDFVKEILPLLSFFKELGVSDVLPVTIDHIHGFQNHNYVENGVDVYKITSISLKKTKVPLQSIVEILIQVQNRADIYSSIGSLLRELISLVVDRSFSEIRTLLPSVKINSSGDFSRGANVSDLQGNFYEFLHSRPVIGQLLDVIDSSLKAWNGKSLHEIIESPGFCKYQCLITKMLGTQGDKNGLGSDRHHGVSRKHSGVGNKQITRSKFEKHHERRNGYKKLHKERRGHEKQH